MYIYIFTVYICTRCVSLIDLIGRKKSKHLSEKKLSNDALKWTLRTRPMASVPPAPRPAAQEKGLETCVKLDIP